MKYRDYKNKHAEDLGYCKRGYRKKNKSNQIQSRFKSSYGKDIINKSVTSEKFNDFFCEHWPYLS